MTVPLSKKNMWLVTMAFAMFTIVFHTYNLGYASYELDEAVHIWYAQGTYAQVIEQSSNDPNPPVYNLIVSAWVKVFGVTEISVRFFSVLMGALGVSLMFVIASRNFGLAVGIMAALFYCFSPIQFRFTHLARPYSMLMVTVLLSYGALFECLRDQKSRKLLWYYLATTLMIYVHPTSVFNLPAQAIMVLIVQHNKFRTMARLALPMMAAVATFGIWVLAIPYFERNDDMWFGPPSLNDIGYVITVLYGNFWVILIQLVMLLAFSIMLKRHFDRSKLTNAILLAIWIMVPFSISICFSHLIKPIFQDKYILSVQPAMMLLLAFLLQAIGNKTWRNLGALVTLTLLISSIRMKPDPGGDWRSAVAHVSAQHDDRSAILIDPWYEHRSFCYYFDRHAFEVPDSTMKLLAAARVFTSWDDVYDQQTRTPKVEVVHLVLAHQGFVEPIVNMDTLESMAGLISVKEFIGVKVMSYQFEKSFLPKDSTDLNSAGQEPPVFVDAKMEFPATLSLTMNKGRNGQATVSASVKVRANTDLKDVKFAVTIERPNAQPIDYRLIEIQTGNLKDGFLEVSQQIAVANFESNWLAKAYVWNVGKKEFQIEDLKLSVQY